MISATTVIFFLIVFIILALSHYYVWRRVVRDTGISGLARRIATWSIGLAATTSAYGCKSERKTDWTPLAEADVVILPDNDPPGETYAERVAVILTKLDPPARVRIVPLPASPQLVEPPLAARSGDEQRPSLPVDQPLGEVRLPDHRLHPSRLVHDDPVEALAEQRDRVVRRLPTNLREPATHVADDHPAIVLLHRHHAVA